MAFLKILVVVQLRKETWGWLLENKEIDTLSKIDIEFFKTMHLMHIWGKHKIDFADSIESLYTIYRP